MPDSRNEGKDIRIKCLVVWDTVGAVFTKPVCGRESDLLGMPDSELPPNVDHALHAMAFHENRRLFRATLFKSNDHTRLREIWFPGAHADVGGGGKAVSDLPNISLLWVIGEMAEYLKIPNDKLDYPDLGTLTPTDAYHDSSPCRRLLDKCETRLESKLLKPNSFVHETVAYLRNALPNSLDPRPRPTPHILSLQDLSAIQWDIKAYLVSCNTLESLKRSASMTRKMMRTQVSSFRNSILNIPGRTPRPSNATLPPSTLRDADLPRPQASSTYLPSRQEKASSPATGSLNITGHTPRLPTIALPPTTDREANPLRQQVSSSYPPRSHASSTYLSGRRDEVPSPATTSSSRRPPGLPRPHASSTGLPTRQSEPFPAMTSRTHHPSNVSHFPLYPAP
ncbi:hypothetical protein FRC08_014476 [Ceratobasidium sp. 394]|nr:hypothetical protein FRC08_014476 [Ceratobasidium sp. 394]